MPKDSSIDVLSISNVESNLIQQANALNIVPAFHETKQHQNAKNATYWEEETSQEEKIPQPEANFQSHRVLKTDAIAAAIILASSSRHLEESSLNVKDSDDYLTRQAPTSEANAGANDQHLDWIVVPGDETPKQPLTVKPILEQEHAREITSVTHMIDLIRKRQKSSNYPVPHEQRKTASSCSSDLYWEWTSGLGDDHPASRSTEKQSTAANHWD